MGFFLAFMGMADDFLDVGTECFVVAVSVLISLRHPSFQFSRKMICYGCLIKLLSCRG